MIVVFTIGTGNIVKDEDSFGYPEISDSGADKKITKLMIMSALFRKEIFPDSSKDTFHNLESFGNFIFDGGNKKFLLGNSSLRKDTSITKPYLLQLQKNVNNFKFDFEIIREFWNEFKVKIPDYKKDLKIIQKENETLFDNDELKQIIGFILEKIIKDINLERILNKYIILIEKQENLYCDFIQNLLDKSSTTLMEIKEKYQENGKEILKNIRKEALNYPGFYTITENSLNKLKFDGLKPEIINSLRALLNKHYIEKNFKHELFELGLGKSEIELIKKNSDFSIYKDIFKNSNEYEENFTEGEYRKYILFIERIFFKLHKFIDLKNVNEEIKEIFPLLKQLLKKTETVSIDDFLSGIKEINPLQKDFSIKHLLENSFEPIKVTINNKDNKNETVGIFSKGENTGSFQNLVNSISESDKSIRKEGESFKINFASLEGTEGSGKTFLGLKLCLEALKQNFIPRFISIDKNANPEDLFFALKTDFENSNVRYFIFFDDLNNLDLQVERKIFNILDHINMLNKSAEKLKHIFLFSYNPDLLNSKMLNDIRKDFLGYLPTFSMELTNSSEKWISTIMEKIVYDELKTQINNNYELFYSYFDKLISNLSKKLTNEYFDKIKLKKLFGLFAYKSILGDRNVCTYDFEDILDESTINVIRKNKIFTISESLGVIEFNHTLFKNILASDYMFVHIKAEELNDDLSNESLEEYKWKSVMLNIFARLNNATKSKIQGKAILIKGISHHLRRQRDFEKEELFLNMINHKGLREEERKGFLLDKSRHFYNKGEYEDSINFAIESLKIDDKSNIDIEYKNKIDSETYGHISSCLIDLFLPETSIYYLDKINDLKNILDEVKVNLKGNFARSYLRVNNFDRAHELILEKLKYHTKENKLMDILRDQCDIILFKALYFRNSKKIDLFDETFRLAKETLEAYNQEEKKDNMLDLTGSKAYVYRNISYFLPFLVGNEKEDELKTFLAVFENKPGPEKEPIGIYYLNLGYYYLLSGEKEKSVELLKKSEIKLSGLHSHLYLNYSLQYLATNKEHFKELAIKQYMDLKNVSGLVRITLLEFDDLIPEEEFLLPNIFDSDNILEEIKNIFIF